jgi:hypothetical protein
MSKIKLITIHVTLITIIIVAHVVLLVFVKC